MEDKGQSLYFIIKCVTQVIRHSVIHPLAIVARHEVKKPPHKGHPKNDQPTHEKGTGLPRRQTIINIMIGITARCMASAALEALMATLLHSKEQPNTGTPVSGVTLKTSLPLDLVQTRLKRAGLAR